MKKNLIPLFKVYMSKKASKDVSKVINSGFIGQGPIVEKFEEALRNRFRQEHIVTTNSATSAEHLAIRMLQNPSEEKVTFEYGYTTKVWPGIKEGDEALCTSLTCTATNFPVLANGMKIKWVDVNPNNLNMDLDDLKRKITKKTKVIMGVHWGGYPLDLDKLRKIRTSFRSEFGWAPAVIEDGAHSFGSKYKGEFIGTSDNLTMFSLQAIKHITSIDGGLLFSPHQELHDRGKLIRWYGIDRDSDRKDFRCEADIEEWGYKFHMNDVCATVGMENFKHLDDII